jgi:hypothetical protein
MSTGPCCLVCGAAATQGGTVPVFAFCRPCGRIWIESAERARAETYGGFRAAGAVADFVRRLKAERLNGETP